MRLNADLDGQGVGEAEAQDKEQRLHEMYSKKEKQKMTTTTTKLDVVRQIDEDANAQSHARSSGTIVEQEAAKNANGKDKVLTPTPNLLDVDANTKPVK